MTRKVEASSLPCHAQVTQTLGRSSERWRKRKYEKVRCTVVYYSGSNYHIPHLAACMYTCIDRPCLQVITAAFLSCLTFLLLFSIQYRCSMFLFFLLWFVFYQFLVQVLSVPIFLLCFSCCYCLLLFGCEILILLVFFFFLISVDFLERIKTCQQYFIKICCHCFSFSKQFPPSVLFLFFLSWYIIVL